MKKIMLIGFGAMAKEVIARLPEGVAVGWIVARERHHPQIRKLFAEQTVVLNHPDECLASPELVLECASQQAVAEFGPAVLRRGWTLAIISTGALAEASLYAHLQHCCQQYRGHLLLLSGAVAGMDGLTAAREGGLQQVTYQSCKSPASWRGSAAEQMIDLNQVTEPQVFFSGSAREAARLFPANANVAATIALSGIGMDVTEVELKVDPATQRNTHTVYARGTFGEFHVVLSGNPLASNPKTSTLAALSAVQVCRRLVEDDLSLFG
ncbi:aspartate dehydrogenase [Yersinia pseudotuberculosis]|uniref:L-aspartate dehydrogenase n=2 Tax=Yersinia pseudotuberculosis complex TaxID=1649845 RepID=A0A0T9JMQ3_YERPU|nr:MULTISPECIES: aspartate dehydrogenase [Yersinia pseudotuberculosis complex]PSH18187.1 aspartate dehydrogenase [Yersinia pseudotuberculosis]CND03644.1 L-aspartate dehydrogenase [Yersinia pseudotuberculosis]CRG51712.1 L-aspartate dehydrogenase [Yersinia wautersii]SUP85827.1 L-aspartate dehydrogenase [Yersinia pseudotuberculosis]